MSKQDYYKTLGVSNGASDDEIKKAYRKLAMQHHPDRNKGDKASEEKFKEANEAYETLKDSQKRAAYDRYGHSAFEIGGAGAGGFGGSAGGFEDISDIFGDIFGDFMGGGGSRRSSAQMNRGSDLRKDITITLQEAYDGAKKKIDLRVPQSCSSCKGSGSKSGKTSGCKTCHGSGKMRMQQGFFMIEKTCGSCGGTGQSIDDPCGECRGEGRSTQSKSMNIDIPAGIEDGVRMRIPGAGEAGYRGGGAGDLYLFISIETHKFFKRNNNDIYCDVPIKMTQAILGGSIEVPSLNGKTSIVKIPAGTQAGIQFKLKGKGMPVMRSGGRHGNMIINIQVEVPVNITGKQRELLQQFEEESSANNSPESEDFFSKVKGFFGK